ncbi:hypothetical protein Herbaro_09335 [Herbaspirillum sp. WKF16]|uniref:hypothetical protein n=1 Tax=Herbaspirillum sp. WKF16 TaxID=3028312 RepID=UPI0023A9C870|nr:hypothetical protein [Herbaspirillum sp. WKF16]WDZ97963.1 hypothetical protein Herbaro_09335 [Herbaspirillum sp. WKF16]
MIAGIPAEDRPTIITQRVPAHVRDALLLVEAIRNSQAAAAKRCLSCGAKTNEHGALPCGH